METKNKIIIWSLAIWIISSGVLFFAGATSRNDNLAILSLAIFFFLPLIEILVWGIYIKSTEREKIKIKN